MAAQRCQVLDLQRLTNDCLQGAQGRIEVVAGLDFLGLGQLIARLGFQQVGTGTLAALEQAPVQLQLLGIGTALGLGQGDLLVGEQRFAVGAEHPHRQLLAAATKTLVRQQRLGHTLAVLGPGAVVEQRLLQGQCRGVAAIVTLAGDVAAGVGLGHFGIVAGIVVAVGQVRQQRCPADGAALKAGIALGDGGMEGRVVAQGQGIGITKVHRSGRQAGAQQQQAGQHTHRHHSSARATCTRSVNGLNR
ncbi:hypothetical protein D3C85_1195540 [compost metagenome]